MSMISQNHLKIQNLDWNYGSQRVLNNLNFNIEKGKFYTILGPNGSGKTTLAKIITKSLEIDSDKIFLISEDLSKMNNKQTAKRIATNYITKSNPNMRNTVHKVFSSLIVSHLNFK